MEQLLTYVMIIIMGGILSLSLCVYALFRLRNAPGGSYYCTAAFLVSMFNFAYLFELTSSDLASTWFWLRAEYVFLPFIPAFTFLMCCDYIGYKPRRWMYWLLFVIPAVTVVMQHTNEWHHFYYTAIRLSTDTPFPITQLDHGPYFYVHSIYLYGCLAIGVLMLLSQMRKVRFRFRLQILTMVAGLLAPVIASVFYVSGDSLYGIDLGPFFISVSFVFHSIALFRYQMFDVAPIARDIIFESMGDGVLVVNENGVLIDYNPAVGELLPGFSSRSIGQPLVQLLEHKPDLFALLEQEKDCDYMCFDTGSRCNYRIRFSPVKNKKGVQVGTIVIFANVTEQALLQEQLQYLAERDGLTGLLNKTALLYQSQRILDHMMHQGKGQMAVIMFDVDEFKQVNDTFGHEAGDIALLHLSDVVREGIQKQHLAGRYGGDEFIICMPGASLSSAYDVAESLRRDVAEKELKTDDHLLKVTSSFGVTAVEIRDEVQSLSIQQLIKQADQALYVSKRAGRNRVQLYEEHNDTIHVKHY